MSSIPNERLIQLTELGFGRVPDCDPSFAFKSDVVAYDTNMIVRGDHADDCAYIYYSRTVVDGEILDGFFFAPSLFEHPWVNHQICNIDGILKEIEEQVSCFARLVGVGGIWMIYVEIDEYCWKMKDLRFPFSDMLKLVGILDYFLSRQYNLMLQENNKLRNQGK